MERERLVVATMRRWVGEELRLGAPGLEVVTDLGLDLPPLSRAELEAAAWWTPMAHAARVLRAGVRLELAAPRDDLLDLLGREVTGREVVTTSAEELLSSLERGEVTGGTRLKPAGAKVEWMPMRLWGRDELPEMRRQLERLVGVSPRARVQTSRGELEIAAEHRVTTVEGEVVTSSPYMVGTQVWEEGMERPTSEVRAAESFAREVLLEQARLGCRPSAQVLDVGVTSEGLVLVEANPVWCAAFYGANLHEVVRALLAARHSAEPWVPDPHDAARAARQRVLMDRRA